MKKLLESRETNEDGTPKYPHIYSIQLPTRKVKKVKPMDLVDPFLFRHSTGDILDMTLEEAEMIYKVNKIEDLDF